MYFAGCPIILPRENESVLLGAAVLGAVAGKKFPVVRDAMKALNAAGKVSPIRFFNWPPSVGFVLDRMCTPSLF
jgi:hypothetical protein